MVKDLTYESLITAIAGVTVARALVNVVINQQIGQQISVSVCLTREVVPVQAQLPPQVDTISEVLQQRCGTFCSTDDVLLYKVTFDLSVFRIGKLTGLFVGQRERSEGGRNDQLCRTTKMDGGIIEVCCYHNLEAFI